MRAPPRLPVLRSSRRWRRCRAGSRSACVTSPRRSTSSARGPERFDAPGHRLERRGSDVVLRGRPERGAGSSRGAAVLDMLLPVPGEVEVPEAQLLGVGRDSRFGGCIGEPAPDERRDAARWRSIGARGPLSVRNRRTGDWFRPPGLGGRKKLQDFFVDRKVPRERRDAVPLVVDERDRIVWVAGHSADAEFLVRDPAQAVIILRLRLWGGSA